MPRVGATPISTSPQRIAIDPELPSPAPAGRDHAAESATPLSARKAAGSVGLRLGRLPAFSATGFVRLQDPARAAAAGVEETRTLCQSMLEHTQGLQRLPPRAMEPAEAARQLDHLCKRTDEALGRLDALHTAGKLDRAKVADCRQSWLHLNAELRTAMAGLSGLDAAALLDDNHNNEAVKASTTRMCGEQAERLEQGLKRLRTQTAGAQVEAHPASPDETLFEAGRLAPDPILSGDLSQIEKLVDSVWNGTYYADQHVTAAKLRVRLDRRDFAAEPEKDAAVAGHLAVWEQMHAQYGGTMPPNTLPGAYAHLAPPPTPGDDR